MLPGFGHALVRSPATGALAVVKQAPRHGAEAAELVQPAADAQVAHPHQQSQKARAHRWPAAPDERLPGLTCLHSHIGAEVDEGTDIDGDAGAGGQQAWSEARQLR